MQDTVAYEDLLAARHGEHVLHLTLNRPALRNALRNQSLREIVAALARAEEDDSVRVVVISGNEKAKGRMSNLWRYRALVDGFYIFKHEDVFLMQKPKGKRAK